MDWLIVPVLIAIVGAPFEPFNQASLTRFERIAREQGRTLVVIEGDGHVRVGRLAAADASGITLGVADKRLSVAAADIVRVDRDGDSVADGLARGALFGAVIGLSMAGFYGDPWPAMLASAMTYGVIGTVIDWKHHGKTLVYRVRVR
jgi:hypothetical protein